MAFVSTLNMEQISTTASVLLEHYIRSSEKVVTSHAEDVLGLQTILSLMNKLAVQPGEASSSRQSYSSKDTCWNTVPTQITNQANSKSLEALLPRPDDHEYAVARQCCREVREVPSGNIDVDV